MQQEGWRGRKNGDLLAPAAREFDVFITTDRGIPHQQHLAGYDIAVVLVEAHSNRVEDLAQLVLGIKAALSMLHRGVATRVHPERKEEIKK